MIRMVGAAVVIGLMSGCSGAQSVTDVPDEQQPPGVTKVAASGHCGLQAPGLMLIETPEQAQRLAQGYPTKLFEDIARRNFDANKLLIVAVGQRPTAGYQLVLGGAVRDGQQLDIAVDLNKPGQNEMAAQVITTPCLVIQLPADGWSQLQVSGDNLPTQTVTLRAAPD